MSSLNAEKDHFLNYSAIFYNNEQKTKKLNMLSIQHLLKYLYYTESGTLLALHNSQGRSSVPPQDCINEFIIRRLNLSVIVDLHSCICNEQ